MAGYQQFHMVRPNNFMSQGSLTNQVNLSEFNSLLFFFVIELIYLTPQNLIPICRICAQSP